MNKWRYLLFILVCLSQVGCAALLTEQEYVLIDRDVEEKMTFHGEIYSLISTFTGPFQVPSEPNGLFLNGTSEDQKNER